MQKQTKKKLTRLANMQGNSFTMSDAKRVGISSQTLYRLRDSHVVIPISRGVYQLAENQSHMPDYAAIQRRVPDGVLCLISALYHHGLTTELPRRIHLAVSRNANIPKIDYPLVQIFRMSPGPFSIGVQHKLIGGEKMNIFSPEKTIVDCFKYRDRFGLDLAISAMKAYSGVRPTLILELAKECRVRTIIEHYLKALI
jgi:predicted transcriptional regulator of viral defense system